MQQLQVELPWPSTSLSPNARVHWSTRWKHVRQYRFRSSVLTQEVIGAATLPAWMRGQMDIRLEFCAPDRRKYDRDNLVARMKSGLDGIADALAIDDAQFRTLTALVNGTWPQGKVRVIITPAS